MKHIVGLVLLAMLVLPLNLYAADKASVPKEYRTPQGLYLTPKETYKLVKDRKQGKNLLFLDIRTQAELEFVGWTNLVDANLPYLFNDFDEWNSKKHWFAKGNNTEFVRRVKAHLARKNSPKTVSLSFSVVPVTAVPMRLHYWIKPASRMYIQLSAVLKATRQSQARIKASTL